MKVWVSHETQALMIERFEEEGYPSEEKAGIQYHKN